MTRIPSKIVLFTGLRSCSYTCAHFALKCTKCAVFKLKRLKINIWGGAAYSSHSTKQHFELKYIQRLLLCMPITNLTLYRLIAPPYRHAMIIMNRASDL